MGLTFDSRASRCFDKEAEMGEGLDLATWLTIPGVLLLFFGLPLSMLEYDRRKKIRETEAGETKGGRPLQSPADDA